MINHDELFCLFINDIHDAKLELVQILDYNKNKNRYTGICLNQAKTKVFVKWNSKDNQASYSLFRKEIEFYQRFPSCSYRLGLLFQSECLAVYEYFVSECTVRDYLLENRSDNEIYMLLKQYVEILGQMQIEDSPELYTKDSLLKYRKYLRMAATSQPTGNANNINPFVKATNKLVWRIINHYGTYKRVENRLKQRPYGQSLTHGDLHLNNILMGMDGRLVLVDWEDSSRGFLELDTAYCNAQINLLISKQQRKYLDLLIKDAFGADRYMLFKVLANEMKCAITINSTFLKKGLKNTLWPFYITRSLITFLFLYK